LFGLMSPRTYEGPEPQREGLVEVSLVAPAISPRHRSFVLQAGHRRNFCWPLCGVTLVLTEVRCNYGTNRGDDPTHGSQIFLRCPFEGIEFFSPRVSRRLRRALLRASLGCLLPHAQRRRRIEESGDSSQSLPPKLWVPSTRAGGRLNNALSECGDRWWGTQRHWASRRAS
jgi:hypothetical protein